MIKKIVVGGVIFIGMLILFLVSTIAPIDYTPLDQLPEVSETIRRLDKMQIKSSEGDQYLKAGWSAVNITPKSPINMAGYGQRGPYVAVMDSLYTRSIVLDNGETKLAIISLDLLMFPRFVMEQVYDTLQDYGFSKDQLFLCWICPF